MNRAGRLVRAAPLLLALAVLALAVLSAQSARSVSMHTERAAAQAPADPEPPRPEPLPAPGPTTPDPEPGPAQPGPTPGPTPAPDRPSPGPSEPSEPSSPSSPEPTPGPTQPACEAEGFPCDTGGGGFDFGNPLDIPGLVVNAITEFLGTLIEQVMKPVREFLADTLLATPDVTKHADIKKLWTAMLGITVGIYVLFVTAGGITVMGYETVQTRYAVKQIVPRLFLGLAAAAASLTVMGKSISLSNALSHAIMDTDMSDAGQGMVERVLPFALFGVAGLKLYLLLLAIVVIVLVLAVLIGFLVRVAVMALLAVSAPLALACHAHPLTDPVARLWWRALAGCLVIQVAQSMTFILSLKLFFAPGATTLGIPKSDELGTMLAGLALFWVLFKIPGWTLQVILRGTPAHSPHAPTGVRILKHLAMYRLMDHYLPGMSRLRRRPGRTGGGGSSGGRGFGLGRGGPGGGGGAPRRGGRGRGGGGGHGSGRPPGPGPGSGPGPGHGGGVLGRGRALLARGRAALGRPGARPGAGGQPAPRPPGGQTPRRRGPGAAPLARAPRGPRAVIHPAQARRIQQLTLPIPAERVPTRPARPTQLWLPIRAERAPAPPSRARAMTAAPPPSRPAPAPAPRTRQLALPIPATRVRVRPPRPMQLRLPLEPPRR